MFYWYWMFGSKSRDALHLPELSSTQDFDDLLAKDLSVVFKHSPTCVISRMAHSEVERFRAKKPDAPIHIVSVRRRRDVSLYIAERTGVEHESPQIVVLRHGKVVASASHERITAALLEDLLGRD